MIYYGQSDNLPMMLVFQLFIAMTTTQGVSDG